MPHTPTSLHILGAGTPTPTPTRFGSAYVVDVDSAKLMFDCGPAATRELVQSGLHPTGIDNLFFRHHHFDHRCFLDVGHVHGLRFDLDATLALQLHGVEVLCSCKWRSETTPVRAMMRSASVVLPWSTCAMMQKLRIWDRGVSIAGMIQSYRTQVSGDCYASR